MEKVAVKGSAVLPHTIPPTSSSAGYHGYCVNYQVMESMGGHNIVPEDWGWTLKDHKLLPVTTNKGPAPKKLLEMIHCNCKGKCNRTICSCKKHGLPCSYACGTCKGISCENCQEIDFSDAKKSDNEN